MTGIAVLVAAAATNACGASRSATGQTLTLRVEGTPSRNSTSACMFQIRASVVGGGTQTTCLTSVEGVPGPYSVIRGLGTMTFELPDGTITASVHITQRFGSKGTAALQTLHGSIVTGTVAYADVGGTIAGGGTVVDQATGLGHVSLKYTLTIRRP